MDKQQATAVLARYAAKHGRYWKRDLRESWMSGIYDESDESNLLQQIRNTLGLGPQFLIRVRVPKVTYEVICGNIGTVYSGHSPSDASMTFIAYADKSARNEGRAAGESVTIMLDGEPINEYVGTREVEETL